VRIDVHESATVLASRLADEIAGAIESAPAIVLGLPTGGTPIPIYRALVELTRARQLDWSRVRTFSLDEFIAPATDGPQPYERFLREQLFSRVNLDPARARFPDGRARDVEAECARYDRAIADAGGLDLVLLGIGRNGHIGFNEPADVLVSRTHRATLEESSREANRDLFGGRIEDVPREAISMGLATILGARRIVLVATGEAKAAIVARACTGEVTTTVPASFLQLHQNVTVALDRAAASAISSSKQG
jgi:glucosamine-6-phosphate deaminase